ncbi:Mur ligase family protein [Parendozoicomonas haliclonae]|uniref:UDP-N-acetylmuramoyl-L-alanyl-D-glutamate-L-lysine ligase n=1 Tax=Parendozoicomonas haliclonae TaxID=1960125 RepID=A0A1X7AK05_9GAMM|nr:UDP-N-acetylmuramoyl-L-alanyl-D-glutamate--2,6-diaminopimelate ligase [Parendozoicomonas haliclonae]SMA42755.1 UDP-N-acetylmuramoyl-L-alanyl-D-glutamate-L-lysine ligase [Parendozoicomonas haliclonae]
MHDFVCPESLRSALEQLKALPVSGFQTDSRAVQPGHVFVCKEGLTQDGHQHIHEAVTKGAIAIIALRPVKASVPVIVVENFAATVELVSAWYNTPQKRLYNIGVTGTNGKTTVAYILAQMLNQTTSAAYTGTLGCLFDRQLFPLTNTTPDPLILLTMMHEMVEAGVECQVMEVSSHALDQGRVAMMQFDCVIFTNIGEDHLDYHGSREEYVQAKLTLLDRLKDGGTVIVNNDDPITDTILKSCPASARVISYSHTECTNADIKAMSSLPGAAGTAFELHTAIEGKESLTQPAFTPLPFLYNLENSLAALAGFYAKTGNISAGIQVLKQLEPVPGRCETIALANGATVLVDYAHNRDGLESLLNQTRALLPTGKLIHLVTGLTGERLQDAEETGALCSAMADKIWFTCHNPLGLAHDAVPLAMQARADKQRCHIVLDRQQAIREAMAELNDGDVLLVCGKGRESYQYMLADKTKPEPYIGDNETVLCVAAELFPELSNQAHQASLIEGRQ